jgi:hypothetical protein
MTGPERSRSDQATGSFAAGAIHLGRGRMSEAVPLLIGRPASVSQGDAWVLLVHGLLASQNGTDGLIGFDSLEHGVERWRETIDGLDRPNSAPRVISRYLAGLLAVARGDTTTATRLARELDQIDRHNDPYFAPEFRDPRELAQTIRAYRWFRADRCDESIRFLDTEKGSYWLGDVASSPLAS